jgi:hypothetical protein
LFSNGTGAIRRSSGASTLTIALVVIGSRPAMKAGKRHERCAADGGGDTNGNRI